MKRSLVLALLFFLTAVANLSCDRETDNTIRVGAKHFNEGYVLGEMIALLLEDKGFDVDRVFNLGGTAIIFEALRNNEIDIYPEYSGTIAREILKGEDIIALDSLRAAVNEKFNLTFSGAFGFNNTYALLMRAQDARRLGIEAISDLSDHKSLRVGLSYEFMDRKDGWRNLSEYYGLPQTALGMEHGLAYQAIVEKSIDVTDAYSTDGEISQHDLMLLRDDRDFFPVYEGVAFYRSDLDEKVVEAVRELEGRISAEEMQRLNARGLAGDESHSEIARSFLEKKNIIGRTAHSSDSNYDLLWKRTWEHIRLTVTALALAVSLAIPLGVVLYRRRRIMNGVLYVTGILQTIPSIALLALMIPLFGIGTVPALIALFLYALLPILRNLMIGLFTIDPQLKKVSVAIGLNRWQQLWYVEFPLALPTLLTGIRTAAVISVGTATLAAFIGAGGLGEYIVTGLALNNTRMIVMGALPSAILAVLIELLFEVLERATVPRHLRQKTLGN